MTQMKHCGITMTVPESKVQQRLAQGWILVDPAAADAPAEKVAAAPTKAELKARLDELGVAYGKSDGVAILRELLEAAEGAEPVLVDPAAADAPAEGDE